MNLFHRIVNRLTAPAVFAAGLALGALVPAPVFAGAVPPYPPPAKPRPKPYYPKYAPPPRPMYKAYTPPPPPPAYPPCCSYVYRVVGYKDVPYTAYDECGHPYTAYRKVPVYGSVKVCK